MSSNLKFQVSVSLTGSFFKKAIFKRTNYFLPCMNDISEEVLTTKTSLNI